MTVNRGGEAAAHELAGGLRTLRGHSGLTTRQLADVIEVSAANVSHWERGERLPNEERLIKLLDALQAPEDDRERLLGLRRQAEGPGELASGAPSIGPQLTRLIKYERAARRITAVAPLLIPGLLQTGDYARATLVDQRDIDTRVTLRTGRRDILTRARQPVELDALIDTGVLTRHVGPPHVMADQLRHLLTMAELPNVSIRLVSSTVPGYNPMQAGAFILLEFPTAPPIVHVEHYEASAFIWQEEPVQGFLAGLEKIHKVAMSPEDSSGLIAEIVNGMETT